MSEVNEVKELVRQLLAAADTPELGARLKQRLQAELERLGAPRFDERVFGYRKFSDFLKNFPDDFELIHAQGPGDLRVRLKSGHHMSWDPLLKVAPQLLGGVPVRELPRVRNDVWQAFTNPDPRRRRFVQRVNGQINHYLEDDTESRFRAEVALEPHRFVEVSPVSPTEQLEWMRDYVTALGLPDSQSKSLLRLAEGPYTSQLNTLFTTELGEFGLGWRRRRAGRVYEHIEVWANRHHVSLQLLIEGFANLRDRSKSDGADKGRSVTDGEQLARVRSIQIINMLSDQDVEELVLPVLLSTIWITTRRSP